MTSFIQFASGHTFRPEVISYILPIFTLRQSVDLRVIAGPDSLDSHEPTIHIENLVEIDAEYRAYGAFPEFIVIARETAQQTLQASSDTISDSPLFLAALMKMNAKVRERFVDEVTADVRQIHQYHAQYRDALLASSATSDDEPMARLSVDSKGETITPDRIAKRITNRTLSLKKRLADAGILKSGREEGISGAIDLIEVLVSKNIDFSHEDVSDIAGSLPTFRWIERIDPPVNTMSVYPTVEHNDLAAA